MAKTLTTRYDVAEHLGTPEEMAAYLEACLAEAHGDAAFIAKALGDIARAKGMTQVARDAVEVGDADSKTTCLKSSPRREEREAFPPFRLRELESRARRRQQGGRVRSCDITFH